MVRRKRDRGFALLVALGVLLLVAGSVLLAFRTAVSRTESLRRERRLVELRAASDAALAETMAALEEDARFRGFPPHRFAGSTLTGEVVRRADGNLDVTVSAGRNGWSMELRAIVAIAPSGRASILAWHRSPVRAVPGDPPGRRR